MKAIHENKAQCYGCSACVSICPKHIIMMQRDKEGFSYSLYDESACIHCGKCQEVCPAFTNLEFQRERQLYAFRSSDREERLKSTSGGAFAMLAKTILQEGGVAIGAAYDEEYRVIHRIAADEAMLSRLRGSKYVQSEMSGLYEQIQTLVMERKVLYCGTPCQCDAVRRYMIQRRANMENLVLCDLICGKVASPGIWEEYVGFLERRFKGKLTEFICRSKRFGWNYHKSFVRIGDKDVSSQISKEYNWIELYFNARAGRPSCYECPFTRVERNTDLTIGDFWGIEKQTARYNDETGVSLVIVQSEKGKDLFEKTCIEQCGSAELYPKEACMQERLNNPAGLPSDRLEFYRIYSDEGIEGLIKAYARRNSLKRFVYSTVIPLARRWNLYDLLFRITHKV